MGRDISVSMRLSRSSPLVEPDLSSVDKTIFDLLRGGKNDLARYVADANGIYMPSWLSEYYEKMYGAEWCLKLDSDFNIDSWSLEIRPYSCAAGEDPETVRVGDPEYLPEMVPFETDIKLYDGRAYGDLETTLEKIGVPSSTLNYINSLLATKWKCFIGQEEEVKRELLNELLILLRTDMYVPPSFVGEVTFEILVD